VISLKKWAADLGFPLDPKPWVFWRETPHEEGAAHPADPNYAKIRFVEVRSGGEVRTIPLPEGMFLRRLPTSLLYRDECPEAELGDVCGETHVICLATELAAIDKAVKAYRAVEGKLERFFSAEDRQRYLP
jgi:hypothetical protein